MLIWTLTPNYNSNVEMKFNINSKWILPVLWWHNCFNCFCLIVSIDNDNHLAFNGKSIIFIRKKDIVFIFLLFTYKQFNSLIYETSSNWSNKKYEFNFPNESVESKLNANSFQILMDEIHEKIRLTKFSCYLIKTGYIAVYICIKLFPCFYEAYKKTYVIFFSAGFMYCWWFFFMLYKKLIELDFIPSDFREENWISAWILFQLTFKSHLHTHI